MSIKLIVLATLVTCTLFGQEDKTYLIIGSARSSENRHYRLGIQFESTKILWGFGIRALREMEEKKSYHYYKGSSIILFSDGAISRISAYLNAGVVLWKPNDFVSFTLLSELQFMKSSTLLEYFSQNEDGSWLISRRLARSVYYVETSAYIRTEVKLTNRNDIFFDVGISRLSVNNIRFYDFPNIQEDRKSNSLFFQIGLKHDLTKEH